MFGLTIHVELLLLPQRYHKVPLPVAQLIAVAAVISVRLPAMALVTMEAMVVQHYVLQYNIHRDLSLMAPAIFILLIWVISESAR